MAGPRLLATGALVGMITVLALPSSATAQAPPGDSVVGGLSDDPFMFIGVDARSGPSGENPTGTARWHEGGGMGPDWDVSITCLAATGNKAVLGFSGTREDGLLDGTAQVAGLIQVVDGGGSEPDRLEYAQVGYTPGVPAVPGPPIPGPTDCSSYPSTFQPWGGTVTTNPSGDIVVTDTRTFPTSKDDCKNGGWQTFGIFKNQGDCVSFVRHQARQECVFIRAAQGRPAFRAQYGRGIHKRYAMRRCIRQRMND